MKYYVYIYLNPLRKGEFIYKNFHFDYEPFYVGIGKGDRMNSHINMKDCKKNIKDVDRVVTSIFSEGKEPIRFKLYENITVESAGRLERILIKLIGRKNLNKGPLANLTNGNEGFIGFHDKKWTLINPNKEEFLIDSNLRKNLRRFGFEYSEFKVKNGIGTKNSWLLKENKNKTIEN